MPRPIELTPELTAQAAEFASKVYYVETLADLLGMSKDTFYRWLRRGGRERRRLDRGLEPIEAEAVYVQFSDAIKKAMAEKEMKLLGGIDAAGNATWQAWSWILERTKPERYSTNTDRLRRLEKRVKELEKQSTGGE